MEESNVIKNLYDLGREQLRNTFLGKIRSLKRLTRLEIAFLSVSLTSLLLCLGFTIERLANLPKDSASFTFASVLIVNVCFCILYVLRGVLYERPSAIWILVLADGIVLLYIVINYIIGIKGPYKEARLILISVVGPFVIIMGLLIARNYHKSKKLIMQTVGARGELQDICSTMFVFTDLLIADLQVSLSVALLALTSGLKLDTEDKVLLPVSLILAFASSIFGYLFVRLESRRFALAYTLIWVTMPGYAIYLIVMAAKDGNVHKMKKSLNVIIFVAGGVCFVVRVATLIFGIKAFFNFGKGLHELVYGIQDKPNAENANQQHEQATSRSKLLVDPSNDHKRYGPV